MPLVTVDVVVVSVDTVVTVVIVVVVSCGTNQYTLLEARNPSTTMVPWGEDRDSGSMPIEYVQWKKCR